MIFEGRFSVLFPHPGSTQDSRLKNKIMPSWWRLGKVNEILELWLRSPLWKKLLLRLQIVSCGINVPASFSWLNEGGNVQPLQLLFLLLERKNEAIFEVRLDKTCPGWRGYGGIACSAGGTGHWWEVLSRDHCRAEFERCDSTGKMCGGMCDSTYVCGWMIRRYADRYVWI